MPMLNVLEGDDASRYIRGAENNAATIPMGQHLTSNKLRADMVDHVFQFGSRDAVAVAGDWNGDGRAEIGVYRNGMWYLDMDGNGKWDSEKDVVVPAVEGKYTPVVGDWNGDGIDNIGLFADGEWYLDTDGDYQYDKVEHLGKAGDEPVAGDWDGDGVDEIGVYSPNGEVATQDARPKDR